MDACINTEAAVADLAAEQCSGGLALLFSSLSHLQPHHMHLHALGFKENTSWIPASCPSPASQVIQRIRSAALEPLEITAGRSGFIHQLSALENKLLSGLLSPSWAYSNPAT